MPPSLLVSRLIPWLAPAPFWVMLSLLLCASAIRADSPDEIPIVGRPADLPFSDASAGFVRDSVEGELLSPFNLDVSAHPQRLEVTQVLLLTVRVQARGPVRSPPSRLDLRLVPAFHRAFYIEDFLDDRNTAAGGNSWVWKYRLRPRSTQIRVIPGLPFVFFNPDIRPSERGFQILWSDPIPLQIILSDKASSPVQAPTVALEFSQGPELLRQQTIPERPELNLIFACLLAPPLLSVVWYLLWKLRYPDAERLARLRRNRAARLALRMLATARLCQGSQHGEQVARAIHGYLADRFGLVFPEPTAQELSTSLAIQGVPHSVVDEAIVLLDRCAALRFGPEVPPHTGLTERATAWIARMEETCIPSSSA